MCTNFKDDRPIDKPTGAEEINGYPIRKAKLKFTYLYKNFKFSKTAVIALAFLVSNYRYLIVFNVFNVLIF